MSYRRIPTYTVPAGYGPAPVVETPDPDYLAMLPVFHKKWYELHRAGAEAIDANGITRYKAQFASYNANFPCMTCRKHLNAWSAQHPIDNYVGYRDKNGRLIGMAHHSWVLHNDVNIRLGKPYMDWTTFERVWLTPEDEIESCSRNCGH